MNNLESCWPTREEVLNPSKESPVKILREQINAAHSLCPNINASIVQEGRKHTFWLSDSDGIFKVAILSIELGVKEEYPTIANGICEKMYSARLNSAKEFKNFLKQNFNSDFCIEILKFFATKHLTLNQ